MNFRQFFTNQHWWGKLIGAIFGYLMAGSVGAFIGVIFGNIFDRGLALHFSNTHLHDRIQTNERVQSTFLDVAFSVMGYLAKADGRVSEKEISMANTFMKQMQLNAEQKKISRQSFNHGKQSSFDLAQALHQLLVALQDNEAMLKTFIDIQFQMAQVDGLTAKKITVLNIVLTTLGFAPLERQSRFYHTSEDAHSYSSSYRTQVPPTSPLDSAYTLLQVKPTSTKQEVKKAYQRLISRHHPDKLIAKGMPHAKIKEANEMTQRIRKAYEEICKSKGW